jgi:hypothetical protein
MTHDDIIRVLTVNYPDSEWSYDGDGTSLDPVENEDGELVSAGLVWHDTTTPAPTLDQLEQALPAAQTADALAAITKERDSLLTDCDWTQLADAPLDDTTKTAWETYRQQLRDYIDQTGFDPLSPPAWPTPPA